MSVAPDCWNELRRGCWEFAEKLSKKSGRFSESCVSVAAFDLHLRRIYSEEWLRSWRQYNSWVRTLKSCHYLLSLFVVSNYVDDWTYRQTAFVISRLLPKLYDIWLNMNWNYVNSVYGKLLIARDIHSWELWLEFFNDMFLLSDAQTQLFNRENLQALNRLANSENTEEQRMAALCYLHLSLHCE